MAGRRGRGESGASLVEFALILPVFFTLLLGMFTGGLAYTRKLAVTDASREGARYGATLPLSAAPDVDTWLGQVADVAVASASGELDPGESGSAVCVAHVPGTGSPRRLQRVGTSSDVLSDAVCYDDGRSNEARVQVVAERTSKLEVLVWSDDLSLTSRSVVRFEAG
ncbi:MAG TPA: TadE family protein [Acidimicrobiales bacterium]|nr:TadE family protein [Acidimicrobiales bacterium]